MKKLLLADLHLDSNPLTEYRWEIFSKIKSLSSVYDIKEVIILGDLTEKKDGHNSLLVNRLTNNLVDVSAYYNITILKGNHDYIDEHSPFFGYLNLINAIQFLTLTNIDSNGDLFIPNIKEDAEKWITQLLQEVTTETKNIFLHQAIANSVSNDGFRLKKGIDVSIFNNLDTNINVFSGDIHIPQKIGRVEYIGAPYNIYFGDNYTGRCILLNEDNTYQDIYFDFLKRHSLKVENYLDIFNYDFNKQDQAKVIVYLNQADYYKWETIKTEIVNFFQKKEVTLVSLEMKPKEETSAKQEIVKKDLNNFEVIDTFGERENLDIKYIDYAKEIIYENQ